MQGLCVAMHVHGKSRREIAKALLISPYTVKFHLKAAADKIPGDLPPEIKLLVWARGATLDVLTGDLLTKSLAYQREQERFRLEMMRGHSPGENLSRRELLRLPG